MSIGDDSVPPMLTFHDVASLHKLLVVEEDVQSINRLTFILRSYGGTLRTRATTTEEGVLNPHPHSGSLARKSLTTVGVKGAEGPRLKAVRS